MNYYLKQPTTIEAQLHNRGCSCSVALFIKSILLFFYVYETNCSVWGLSSYLTTRRIVVALLLIWFCLKRMVRGKRTIVQKDTPVADSMRNCVWLFLFVLLYSGFLLVVNGGVDGESVFASSIRFFSFGILAIPLFLNVIRNKEELIIMLMLITAVQCIIIFFCIVSPAFASSIDYSFGQDGRFGRSFASFRRAGYASGIACTIAKGSIKLSLGSIACISKLLDKNNKRLPWLLMFVFFSIISTAVSRTGLVICVACLVVLLLGLGRISVSALQITTAIFIVVLFAGYVYLAFFADANRLLVQFARLINLFDKGLYQQYFVGFVQESAVLPPISWNTIIGAGVTSGVSGSGVRVNIDGGYLRMYVGIGLPMCIMFYLSLFSFLKKPLKGMNAQEKYTLWLYIIVLIIGEFKEYTLFEGYLFCMYWVLANLSGRVNTAANILDNGSV